MGGRTVRINVNAADAVPDTAASLFVASAVAGATPGITAMMSGISTSPPPPITASTHPATAAPPNKSAHCASSSSMALLRSEEHTSELQSRFDLVCRLLLERQSR